MATKAEKAEARESALAYLKPLLPKGAELTTVLASVSASGMTRRIKFLLVRDGEIDCVSRRVAEALGYRYDERYGAVVVSGCGMDMGYHVAHNLSRALFPEVGPRSGYELRHRWV